MRARTLLPFHRTHLTPGRSEPNGDSINMKRTFTGLLAVLLTVTAAVAADRNPEPYDLWVKGGLVHVGDGSAPIQADVLIRGDQIVRVGGAASVEAKRVIDASGKIVAPGFIDTHSHGDPLEDASFENFALQGVTSIVLGQDGATPGYESERGEGGTPRRSLAEWFTGVGNARLQTNVATLVGHGTLRRQAGVDVTVEPTAAQMSTMQSILQEGLNAGAFGMSSGLEYVPGRYALRGELVALADIVGEADGVVMSHMRSEDSDKVVDALDELLAQSRRARVHVSHLKIVFAKSAAEGERVVALLDGARSRGVSVTADVYPYLAGYGDLSLVYPPWARTRDEWNNALASDRPKLEAYLRERIALRGGPEAILLAEAPYANRTLAQIAAGLQRPAEEVVIDVLGFGGPSAAHFNMRADVQDRFIAWEHAAIATDGGPTLHHPRSWGTYPKVLQEFVRDRKVLTMEQAIRKMTSLPAAIVDLPGRGQIKEGYYADLVIFAPNAVRSTATWEKPAQAPVGVEHVVVNGCVQVEASRMTANACGRLLRKEPGPKAASLRSQ
jgi:N-acyl-D-amino-acid deacylase